MVVVPATLTCLSQGCGEVVRSEEPPVGPARWEILWNKGPLLKGYCKHRSCSVNTKLEPSWSSPAGLSSAAGFPPILGAKGWGLGVGAWDRQA